MSSTTPATANAAFVASCTANGVVSVSDQRGDERHGVLHRGRRAEVDVGAEPLLVDPARGQADQRDQEQQDRRVDALLGDQPARARREHRRDAEDQGEDPPQRQPVAQERRGEQRGRDGVHRDDHRAQHGGRAVLDGEVERAELDGLHQQAGDRDVAELATRRPCHPRDRAPRRPGSTAARPNRNTSTAIGVMALTAMLPIG